MKLEDITIVFSVGMFIYLTMFYFIGPAGIGAKKDLVSNIEKMTFNLNEIKITNNLIKAEISDIQSSPDYDIIKARNAGYYRQGEHVIKFIGFKNNQMYYSGNLIKFNTTVDNKNTSSTLIRTSSLITVFFLILIGMIFSIYRSNITNKNYNNNTNKKYTNSGYSNYSFSSKSNSEKTSKDIQEEINTRVIITDDYKENQNSKSDNNGK